MAWVCWGSIKYIMHQLKWREERQEIDLWKCSVNLFSSAQAPALKSWLERGPAEAARGTKITKPTIQGPTLGLTRAGYEVLVHRKRVLGTSQTTRIHDREDNSRGAGDANDIYRCLT